MKNVYCKNTKLTESEFGHVVFEYLSLTSVSKCAQDLERSRQSIQGIYNLLGERLVEVFEQNEVPNFSTALAIEMCSQEKELRLRLRDRFKSPIMRLKLIRAYETMKADEKYSNTILLKMNENGTFGVIFFDNNGSGKIMRSKSSSLHSFLMDVFTSRTLTPIAEIRITEQIKEFFAYTSSEVSVINSLAPSVTFEQFTLYKNDSVQLHKSSCNEQHGEYRILNCLNKIDRVSKGFGRDNFDKHHARARFLELMFWVNLVSAHYNDKQEYIELTGFARRAAYVYLMLALRVKPLNLS